MISLFNVSKSYNDKIVLDIEYISFNTNELTAIIGSSGSGKTTLLNILGALEKPDRGKAIFSAYGEKYDINEHVNEYRARNVGFIFQDSNLINGLSATQNVEIGQYFAGISNIDADATLRIFGLQTGKQNSETLSGGEKQRVAIVRAISKNAKIILADEPSGNLDIQNAHRVFNSLRELKHNRAVIVVTHDESLAKQYADRIIRFSDGKIVSDERLNSQPEGIFDTKQVSYSCNELKPTAATSKKKAVFVISKNSIRTRFGRMLMVILVSAISLSSVVSVQNMNVAGRTVSDTVDRNYLETDLITLRYGSHPMGRGARAMDVSFVSEILQDFPTQDMVEHFSGTYYLSTERNSTSVDVKSVNINLFFENRVMSNDIKGSFINNHDEIIISYSGAMALFGTVDCVGEAVKVHDGSGNSVDAMICGVNFTEKPDRQIYTFVSATKMKELRGQQLKATTQCVIEIMRYETQQGIVPNNAIKASYASVVGNEEIIWGRLPEFNSGEVLISLGLLQYCISAFGVSDIADHLAFEEITKKEYGCIMNELAEIRICGVYHGDELEVRFEQRQIDMMTTPLPDQVDVYISNVQDGVRIVERINSSNLGLLAISEYNNLRLNVSLSLQFFKSALLVLGVLLGLTSLLMLYSLIKLTLHERQKEIAILKSLGASPIDILWVLLADNFFIATSAVCCSLIISYVLQFVLSSAFKELATAGLPFPLWLTITSGSFYCLILVLLTLSSVIKTAKCSPVSLLKD